MEFLHYPHFIDPGGWQVSLDIFRHPNFSPPFEWQIAMDLKFLVLPSILFLVVVAPIWISHHYRYKSRMAEGLSNTELRDLEELLDTVDRLADRVETLESILAEKHPSWRKSVRGEEGDHYEKT